MDENPRAAKYAACRDYHLPYCHARCYSHGHQSESSTVPSLRHMPTGSLSHSLRRNVKRSTAQEENWAGQINIPNTLYSISSTSWNLSCKTAMQWNAKSVQRHRNRDVDYTTVCHSKNPNNSMPIHRGSVQQLIAPSGFGGVVQLFKSRVSPNILKWEHIQIYF